MYILQLMSRNEKYAVRILWAYYCGSEVYVSTKPQCQGKHTQQQNIDVGGKQNHGYNPLTVIVITHDSHIHIG